MPELPRQKSKTHPYRFVDFSSLMKASYSHSATLATSFWRPEANMATLMSARFIRYNQLDELVIPANNDSNH